MAGWQETLFVWKGIIRDKSGEFAWEGCWAPSLDGELPSNDLFSSQVKHYGFFMNGQFSVFACNIHEPAWPLLLTRWRCEPCKLR